MLHKRHKMNNYITKRNDTYQYRRRVPKQLQDFFPFLTYTKTLAKDMPTAKIMASEISATIETALTMVKLNQTPDLSSIISISQGLSPTLSTLSSAYFKTLSISEIKIREYTTMINTIVAFTDNISHKDLDLIRTKLQLLPRRNIHKYRVMSLNELTSVRTLKKVEQGERLTAKSINEYIKILNSVLAYGYERGAIEHRHRVKLLPITHQARTERSALTVYEIEGLLESAKTPQLALSYQLLYLSGMRLSEAYKCNITRMDDVLCFDLKNSKAALKNSTSYRFIPIHSAIKDPYKTLHAINSLLPDYISKQASKALGGGKKTLYSLRHSFATDLVASGADVNMVSELMGHAHKGMTLNRYAKGYLIKDLQKVVERLEWAQSF